MIVLAHLCAPNSAGLVLNFPPGVTSTHIAGEKGQKKVEGG